MESQKLTADQHACANAVAELIFRLIAKEQSHYSGEVVLDAVLAMVSGNEESCRKHRALPPWEDPNAFPYRLA
jgi:hypothetical protein